jgi:signal transduction histidine kinase
LAAVNDEIRRKAIERMPDAGPGRAAAMIFKRYPSIRTILMIANLAVLILPLGGFVFFRIYENRLVHEAEAELIVQAALLSETMKSAIESAVPDYQNYGTPVEPPKSAYEYYIPLAPQLDLSANEILPPRPEGIPAAPAPDAVMMDIGRRLTALFTAAQKTTLAGMRLLDHRGQAIGGRDETGLSFAHIPEVREAMSGRYASAIRARISDDPQPSLASISRGTGIRVFIVYPVIHEKRLWGLVYMSRTPDNIMRDLYAERGKFILAGVTVLTLALLLALLTSLTISGPVQALTLRARRLAGGGEALKPLGFPGTAEVAELSQSFASMARSLQQRSEYIRNFAAHVSHEFKTPLTAIQGASELLSEHMQTMPEEERARFLSAIQDNTGRLKRLVSRLMELARADNLTPSDELVNVRAALEQVRSGFEGRQIEIEAAPEVQAKISAESLQIVASNLIANAFHHGASLVKVEVSKGAQAVEIAFRDNGEGISERNRARIFEPFFTTRRETGGTGLGLKIAASLLEAHHGAIRLAGATDGTVFVVTVPPA